jgi:lipopolysaccharide transport system ATP-binding protein
MKVLTCDSVSKRYRIRQEDRAAAASSLRRWQEKLFPRMIDFWALRDVSFAVEAGESLGVIGHNGAGKSTLLKLLSNITTPTSGQIEIHGKVSALLEVGSGFHPELSGRENVYLSGSILGMRRAEISSKLDDIVEFAGVRPFIDVPVKRYSSGMYVRLGFAIAAHLDPDVLLLDEVLAVGDAAFQQKCRDRIHKLRNEGTTLVFISHDLAAVQDVCTRAILMQQGQIAAAGTPAEIIRQYQQTTVSHDVRRAVPPGHAFGTRARIVSVVFMDESGNPQSSFLTGGHLRLRLYYEAFEDFDDIDFGVFFYTQDDMLACQFSTRLTQGFVAIKKGVGFVDFTTSSLGLTSGIYPVDATIERRDAAGLDWLRYFTVLHVSDPMEVRGKFFTQHESKVVTEAQAESPDEGLLIRET